MGGAQYVLVVFAKAYVYVSVYMQVYECMYVCVCGREGADLALFFLGVLPPND